MSRQPGSISRPSLRLGPERSRDALECNGGTTERECNTEQLAAAAGIDRLIIYEYNKFMLSCKRLLRCRLQHMVSTQRVWTLEWYTT